jgi:hypothetical protein
MMFDLARAVCVVGLLGLGWQGAGAQTLKVSGSPSAMKITAAVAGLPPTPATNTVTTYTAKAKKATKPLQITAQLNTVMPAGMTLTMNMVPTTGATSQGDVPLDATARAILVNITNTTNQTKAITYVLSATPAAGVVTSRTRTVTLTLTAYP